MGKEPAVFAFVGLGLVGGSLARGALDAGHRTLGWDELPGTRAAAEREGIEILTPGEMIAEADLIVVATPPSEAARVVPELLRLGAPAVTDTASIKAPIFAALGALDPELRRRFVGGHPMAGSQATGWRASDPEIFRGATWAACSPEQPELRVFLLLAQLTEVFSAGIVPCDPERHDEAVAVSSHTIQYLQQAIGAGLADEPPLVHRLSGPALRDTTRLAESPFEGLWHDVFQSSPQGLSRGLGKVIDELDQVKRAVDRGDEEAVRSLWRHGLLGRQRLLDSRWRDKSWRRGSVSLGQWWPGLVALSENGVAIRNPEEDSGALLLFDRTG
jgi:prephenate dehydrogenase